jgi:hypothetical protein
MNPPRHTEFGTDPTVLSLKDSGALIWNCNSRKPVLFINPTINEQENKERHGKPVTAQELFAYNGPHTIYTPYKNVLMVSIDYSKKEAEFESIIKGKEEPSLKLTAIKDIKEFPQVIAALQVVVRRGNYYPCWHVLPSLKMAVHRSIYLSRR